MLRMGSLPGMASFSQVCYIQFALQEVNYRQTTCGGADLPTRFQNQIYFATIPGPQLRGGHPHRGLEKPSTMGPPAAGRSRMGTSHSAQLFS
jgi:hypothetical protein